MTLHYQKSHHNHVGEYQQSSIPFVTSSVANEVTTSAVVTVKLPYVSRWIVIKNTDDSHTLKFGFSANGVNGPKKPVAGNYNITGSNANYFTLAAGATTERLELKCKELHFLGGDNSASFSVLAGLTGVEPDMFPALTGSKGVEGVG